MRDSYNFDFLELGRDYDERELELGLIKNIRSFLLEMGGDFSFIGNQFKLDLDGEEFFVDLLLYHRRLKCLIAIEIKKRTLVEYALRNTRSPVGDADYSLSKTLPKELKGLLPSPDEIIGSLSYITED